MSALGNETGSAARGLRRRLREERARERKLVLRHRWYAGGVAAVLSGALLFAGMTPAVADTTTPSPSPSETSADVSTDPGDTTVDPSTEPTAPATEPTETESPAPEATETAAPEETETPAPEETEATDDTSKQQQRVAPTEDAGIGVQSVPTPGAGEAVITVKVGTDRTGVTGVTNLAGVTLVLNGGQGGPNGTRPDGQTGTNAGWALCVSDAQGDCSFVVPNTGNNGANRDARFWVVQAGVPAGYYANPVLRVGGASGGGDQLAYQFRTGALLRSGNTYSSLSNFMYSDSNVDNASGGIWQQSRNNPALNPSCGLEVALILDISGSVGSALPNLKTAANTFVDSLVGTPSRMSLFSFSWVTPGAGAPQNYPNLTSVSTQAQADVFKNRYSGWTSDGGTNWDRGLGVASAANSGSNAFDVAVVITDGNPTTFDQPYQGTGSDNRFRETENGVFSANAIKAAGSRVIAFGVGAGATGTTNALNLRAISGTTAFNGSNGQTADYYQTTDYAAVGTALRNLALGNCSGNLTVTKQIVPNTTPDGQITGAVPAGGGWQFNGVSNTAGVTTPVADRTTTNDGTGTVTYPLNFPGGVTSGNVTVTETQQSGYQLTQVSSKNAVCKNLNTGASVSVNNAGALGFSVDVPSTQAVNCIVYNRAPNPQADITVTKKWVVNGTPYANGAQPAGLTAQLSLTGPGQAGATPQSWDVARGGYTQGNSTTLSETVGLINQCTNVATVTEVNGAAQNAPLGSGYQVNLSKERNTATITNTVTCTSKLTLKKNVDNTNGGSATKDAWTLKAAGPTTIEGKDGASAVTNAPVTPGSYALTESGTPAGYQQTNLVCDGGTLAGGSVTVPLGGNVTCTFTNASIAPKLTLVKEVVNDNGGTTPKTAWTLTANGASGPNLSGVTGTPAVTAQPVKAGVVYTLGESNIAGYDWTTLSCNGGYSDTTKAAPTLTLKPGDDVTCTFTNNDKPGKLTLVKVVDNANGGTSTATDWNKKLTAKLGDTILAFNHNETKDVSAGTYTLAEIDQIAGYSLTGIVCSTGAEKVTSVTVLNGGNVTCTFTNTAQKPTLTLEKQVVNKDAGTATADEWTLTATNDGVNAINGKGTIVAPEVAAIGAPVVANKPYTLTETGPSGYTAAEEWACTVTGSSTTVPVADGNVVTPKAGQNVTCRIVNTAVPGTGEVAKTVTSTVQNPDGTWTITYKIEVTNTSATSTYTYDLKDVLNYGGGITPAKPTVTGPDGVTVNPAFTGLGANTTIASNVALTKAVGTHTYTVVVVATVADAVADPGNTDAQCKPPAAGGFLNIASIFTPGATKPDAESEACSQPVFPNITKVGGKTTQNPDASFNISYAITVSNPSSTTALQAKLTDAFPAAPSGWALDPNSWTVAAAQGSPAPSASPYAPGNGTIWTGVLAANTTYTYTVTGKLVPGANPTPIGDCDANGGLKNKATVTSGLVVKDAEGCVTVDLAKVTVSKSNAGAVTQLSLTQWEIVYDVQVKNSSATLATTYTLTDTPTPGNGWIVDGSSNWVGTAPTPNKVIAGNATDTYQYRMVVNRNADVANPSMTCDVVKGGGFFNKATVTFPGGTESDTGCGEPGTPTIVKTGKPAVSNGDGTYTISYDVEVSNTSGKKLFYSLTDTPPANPAGTTITDWKVTGPGASATWPTPNQIAATSIADGAKDTFTITAKVAVGTGFAPVPNACGEGTATGVAIINTATVTNGTKDASDDGCTSVNSLPVTVEKKVDSVEQGTDGVWTVKYTVSVKGPASGTTPYSLTDTPAFATAQGVTLTGISWTGQTTGSSPTGPVTLQPGDTISTGQTHTWSVTATATIAVPQGQTLSACEAGKGPFFNSAKVTFPGGDATATACDEPGKPTVEKTALAPSFDSGTGRWTLSYTLTVTNAQGMNLAYTLSDVPAALPAGVTGVTDWTATGPAIAGGTPQDAGTLAGWNGVSGTVATGLITTAATHTYTITRVVTIGANVSGDALSCGTTNGGIKNVGTVTNGVGGNSDTACITIERPGVDIVKTVKTTTQNVDGSWTVVYDVAVTNESPTQPAQYTLTDQIAYGNGIVPTAASWKKEPDGAVTPFQAPITGSQTLATDAVLAGGATDHYTVTVSSTISPDAWKATSSVLTCAPEGTFTAGGFLNTATVTAAGKAPEKDDACSAPELPKILKEGVSATQDAGDPEKWAVTYKVTVTAGAYATYYDLSDTPGFAAGIVLGSGTAQRTDIADQPVVDITSGAPFVTDLAIAANTTHTYTVTWNVTVTDAFKADDATCTGAPGKGFFNAATLTVGDVPIDGTACIPVDPRVYPTIEKTVTSTEQKSNGDWKITYDVVVTLAEQGPENPKGLSAKYDLTDTLDFGGDINVGSAQWSLDGADPVDFDGITAEMAKDKSIAAGGTHTYTVSVVAEVTEAAIDGGTTACLPGENPGAGGFLNTAQLESGGQLTDVDACSEPVFPDVDKTPMGDAVFDPETGLWRVSYEVTVSYPDADADGAKPVVAYTLTDQPTLPANVQLQGDWTASAANDDTPDPTAPTWNSQGTWTIVSSTLDPDTTGVSEHVYEVTAEVRVTAPPASEQPSCDGEPGIVVLNGATITSGAYSDEDDACQVVQWDDVGIEKTSELPEGQTSVEPGDTFDYVLTVTNYGTRAATNVRVTDDDLNDRLEILGMTVEPDSLVWNGPGYEGNVVDLTIQSLPVGGVATITIEVRFLPAAVTDDDIVGPGEEPPAAPTPVEVLENEACVAADNDGNPDNNCDDEEIPARDLTGVLYLACVSDAAQLGWNIAKSGSLVNLPTEMLWVPNNAVGETVPPNVQMTQPAGSSTWSDVIDWPGSYYTPSGVAIDYPGWRAIVQSDIVPGSNPTQYYLPGTSDVMTPEQQEQFVYNGLILDPSELDFAWREGSTVTFSVNPELVFETSYPDATPEDCSVARQTEVQIEKTASVEKTEPGTSFTYDLAVANVSDDSAADGVVVTDAIPADLKITDVSWTGKGDANAFPNWTTCEVTGQTAGGYGGTLECVLFGPLQPVGTPAGGTSAAPTITLTAYVNPAAKGNVINNIGVVDYYTFGDPEDSGRDQDDATVLLSALPATGGESVLPIAIIAIVALAGGLGALIVVRRRRGESRPVL